jgi:trk system potassium uptake protein TrkH
VSRIAIYVKTSLQEIRHMISPNRMLPIKFEKKTIDTSILRGVSFFFMTYIFFFSICLLIVSLDAPNFVTAFSAVAATINNIGPGLDMVGPAGNYAAFSDLTKLTLSIAMIAGRLEIFPVLILLSPRTWRKT